MMLGLLVEALWTLPVIGLMLLMRKKLAKHPAWRVLVGAGMGALYAVALSFLVGTSILMAYVPFFPLAMTVGTAVGAAPSFGADMRTSRRWSVALCLVLICAIWAAFYVASASLEKRESFRLVVIKLASDSQPLHWVQDGGSISLSSAEKHAIEEATRSVHSGALVPLTYFERGHGARATVVLVMSHDISGLVRLPKPARGLITYVQKLDGSWQDANVNVKGYAVVLSPENSHTQITVESALGTTGTDVSVSGR